MGGHMDFMKLQYRCDQLPLSAWDQALQMVSGSSSGGQKTMGEGVSFIIFVTLLLGPQALLMEGDESVELSTGT
jgi:hypothetical protein